MKKILRKIIKKQAVQSAVAYLIHLYLVFVFKTSRWTYHNFEPVEALVKNNQTAIITFFHGKLAMMSFAWTPQTPFRMLLSDHADGHFIAKVVKFLRIDSVYGSSTRGGAAATRQLIKHLKDGACIGITPDGPKGPCHSFSDGPIYIAKLAKVPIVPMTYSIKRRRILGTWDKFMLPKPFSQGVFIAGNPVTITDINDEYPLSYWNQHLQQIMIQQENEAEQLIKNQDVNRT